MVLTSFPQENSPVCKKKIILAMSNYDISTAREADNVSALRALTLADEHRQLCTTLLSQERDVCVYNDRNYAEDNYAQVNYGADSQGARVLQQLPSGSVPNFPINLTDREQTVPLATFRDVNVTAVIFNDLFFYHYFDNCNIWIVSFCEFFKI